MSTKKNTKVPKADKALDNKCPSCGAPIHFNPTAGKWKCDYCNSEFDLEEMQKYNNASTEVNNTSENNEEVKNTDDTVYISYKCQNCGAEIVADEQTAATFCVYCGNTAILKNKLSGEFRPDFIIPFKTEKEAAIKAFEELSKGRPFMPKDFNSKANIEKIKGIYIPFWLYDFNVDGELNLKAERSHTTSTHDNIYIKTDHYKLYRTATMNFIKIPVDGSTRFDNDIMNSIEPFNYSELIPYNHAYLSGFLAEKYDVDGDSSSKEAQDRALESGRTKIFNDVKDFESKVIVEDNLQAKLTNKSYALLPVWMVNVKYKDKYYLFAMNGQTGEFIGDIPLDKDKVIKWSILSFVIGFIVVTAISYIIYLMGV